MRTAVMALVWCALATSSVPAQTVPLESQVPQLRQLLHSADPAVRKAAAEALGVNTRYDNGLPNVAAVPDLLGVLADDGDQHVAEAAALALRELGAWPPGALEFVEARVADWSDAGAPAATIDRLRTALRSGEKAWPGTAIVPELTELLRAPRCARGALAALAALGADARGAVAAVDALLVGAPVELRWRAAFVLGRIGGERAPSLPAVRDDENPSVRMWGLAAMAADARTAADLVPWLGDERVFVRRWAIRAIAQLGAAAQPVAARLVPLLEDGATMGQAQAALVQLGEHAVLAAPGLVKLLGAERFDAAATSALAAIGPAAAEVAAAPLRTFVTRPVSGDARVAQQVENEVLSSIEAYATIDPAGAAAALWPGFTAVLPSPWPGEWLLVTRFTFLKAAAAAKLPQLRTMLTGGDRNDQLRAIMAVRGIGPAAAPALADVLPLLQHGDAFVRAVACEAIETMGPVAVAALPQLEAAYEHLPVTERRALVARLADLGSAAEPLLLRALASEDESTRTYAGVQLSRLPVLSEPAEGALRASTGFTFWAQRRWPELYVELTQVPWLCGVWSWGLPHLINTWDPARHPGADRDAFLDAAHLTSWALQFVGSDDDPVRTAAASVLGRLPSTPASLAALRKLATDSDRGVRCFALLALARPAARAAIEDVLRDRSDDDWFVRSAATMALRGMHAH